MHGRLLTTPEQEISSSYGLVANVSPTAFSYYLQDRGSDMPIALQLRTAKEDAAVATALRETHRKAGLLPHSHLDTEGVYRTILSTVWYIFLELLDLHSIKSAVFSPKLPTKTERLQD